MATEDLAITVARWLAAFEAALSADDRAALQPLFHADSHWRDVLALSWTIDTASGRDPILEGLAAWSRRARPCGFGIAPGRTPPRLVMRASTEAIEAIFTFDGPYFLRMSTSCWVAGHSSASSKGWKARRTLMPSTASGPEVR